MSSHRCMGSSLPKSVPCMPPLHRTVTVRSVDTAGSTPARTIPGKASFRRLRVGSNPINRAARQLSSTRRWPADDRLGRSCGRRNVNRPNRRITGSGAAYRIEVNHAAFAPRHVAITARRHCNIDTPEFMENDKNVLEQALQRKKERTRPAV